MAARDFFLGETWVIDLFAKDVEGNVLSLDGATVYFRLGTPAFIDLSTATVGVAIVNALTGQARAIITPALQAGASHGVQQAEWKVVLADGTVSVQDQRALPIKKSLFN